ELVDANLDLRRFRACLDHLSENLALLARVASHSLDQVGNELSPPLVLILDLAPGSLGALLERRDRVDAAPGENDACGHHKQEGGEALEGRRRPQTQRKSGMQWSHSVRFKS